MKVNKSYWRAPSRSWLVPVFPVFTWACTLVLWPVSGVHMDLYPCVRCSLGSVPLCRGQCPVFTWICTLVYGVHLGLCPYAVASVRYSLGSVPLCTVFTWVCALML